MIVFFKQLIVFANTIDCHRWNKKNNQFSLVDNQLFFWWEAFTVHFFLFFQRNENIRVGLTFLFFFYFYVSFLIFSSYQTYSKTSHLSSISSLSPRTRPIHCGKWARPDWWNVGPKRPAIIFIKNSYKIPIN